MRHFNNFRSWLRPGKIYLGNEAFVGRLRLCLVIVLHLIVLAGFAVWILDFGDTKKRIMLGAGPRGSESFVFAAALAEVVSRNYPDVAINVLGTEGSEKNMQLMADGKIDMAIIHANARTRADARLIVDLYRDYAHIIVNRGSAIARVKDLVGKRVAVPPKGSGDHEMFWLLLDYYRVAETDVTALPMSWHAAQLAISRGAVDALFALIAPGNSEIFELIKNNDVDVIGVDLAQGLILREPELEIVQLKQGTYGDRVAVPSRDTQTIAVNRMLVARRDVDASLVAKISHTLFENRRDLMELAPLAASVRVPTQAFGTLMPLHEGARAFYERDEPSFLQENAELFALIATAIFASGSGIISLLNRRKRRRIDKYNRDLITMSASIPMKHTRQELDKLKTQLHSVVGDIVRDTERGFISEEAFEFFAFTWRATEAAIRDRESQVSETPTSGTKV